MPNRSHNAAVWVVVVVGVLLATMILSLSVPSHNDVAFAQEGPIQYAEKGDGPVRTFTSTDPEGARIKWDVTGTDADDFEISRDGGVLTFLSSPDYESPTDRAHAKDLNGDDDTDDDGETDDATNNMYQITVRATEVRGSGETGRALSTETDVTVQVTNVNETGSVTFNLLQPEVGTPITAELSDPDGVDGTVTWTWSVSKVTKPVADVEGHWVSATGLIDNATYTPAGDRVDDITSPDPPDSDSAVDETRVLRAVATYADDHGVGKTAIGVSVNPVRAEVSSDLDGVTNPANGSPGFTAGLDYTRSVPESTAVDDPVGDPVEATDPQNDTLTYELVASESPNDADDDSFSIDKATGQISVKSKLDADAARATDTAAGVYKVIVRATDPSGETAEVEVTITATAANDAPVIMGSVASTNSVFGDRPDAPSELRVDEKSGDSYDGTPDMERPSVPGRLNVFTASDEDARGQIFWSWKGEDEDDFELSSSSVDIASGLKGPGEPIALRFKEAPDYENPTDENYDSVYKVTLVATDSAGGTDERPLTIFVDNIQETGKATLSAAGDDPDQPLIGNMITAAVEDPDEGVAIVTWQWHKSKSIGLEANFEVILGATTATYTPTDDDDSYFLRATATYTDTMSDEDDPSTVEVDERTQKEVAGSPEAKESNVDNLYRVMAISKNAVRVDPDDPSQISVLEFSDAPYDRSVVENAEVGSIVGAPVRVMTEEGKTFIYDLNATETNDNAYFTIDEATGQIRVGEVDFPNPLPDGVSAVPSDAAAPGKDDPTLDDEGVNTFVVIVTATDAADDTRKATARVTISLTNLNESPYFDRQSRDSVSGTITYAETRTNMVVPLAAREPDGHRIRWEVTGTDASDFMIVDVADINDGKDRVELRFKNQPNFESPTDRGLNLNPADTDTGAPEEFTDEGEFAPNDNTYQITVRATEMRSVHDGPRKADELAVTVEVTDVDEKGKVELNWLQPEVGTEITAELSDLDGDVTGGTWSWYRAKVNNPNRDPGTDTTDLAGEWELITGAASEDYTPDADDDEGWHLLARMADYDDTQSTGDNTAIGISANRVRADVSDEANNSPDFTENMDTRSVLESAAVGDPVGAPVVVDVNEDPDILTYELVMEVDGDDGNTSVDIEDVAFFSINKATGQIMVAKALSAEETDGRDYGTVNAPTLDLTAGEYVVVVRATDPSGEGATNANEDRDDIVVTITATDVNEAPRVTAGNAELSVDEADSSNDDSYTGLPTDDDGTNDDSNLYIRSEDDVVDRASWPDNPIPGPDGALFEYSTPGDGIGRRLHFKNAPDYENPMDANRDNVYEVTVRVVDGDGLDGEKSVRVTVMNVNEAGKLVLSPEQPHDGAPVMATLTDPDGIVSITDWKWLATPDRLTDEAAELAFADPTQLVPGATTDSHTGEVGQFLWAMVDYRDGASVENDPVTALDERNDDPETTPTPVEQHKFQDRNDDGSVNEGDDLHHNSDTMLSTVTDNAVQADPDPTDGTDLPSTEVIIVDIEVAENTPSTGYVGMPLLDLGPRDTIGGPDGASFVFAENYDEADDNYYDAVMTDSDSIADDPVTTTVDEMTEDADDKMGQLAAAVVTHFDSESAKKTYTIEVTDPDAEVEIGPVRVTITVIGVNEAPSAPSISRGAVTPQPGNNAPEFAAATDTRRVVEGTAAGVDIRGPVTATDADTGDTLTYTLGGVDRNSFSIDNTGQMSTAIVIPDAATKASYVVDVIANDGTETDSVRVTITVTAAGGLGEAAHGYDNNPADGEIDGDEVLDAVDDYFDVPPKLTGDQILDIVDLYFDQF